MFWHKQALQAKLRGGVRAALTAGRVHDSTAESTLLVGETRYFTTEKQFGKCLIFGRLGRNLRNLPRKTEVAAKRSALGGSAATCRRACHDATQRIEAFELCKPISAGLPLF